MPMDEVIRAIERAEVEDLQDVLLALMEKYRKFYPQWRFLFLSADTNAADDKSKAILEIIRNAEAQIE